MKKTIVIDHIDHWAEIISSSNDKKYLEVRVLDRVACHSCPAEDLCLLSKKQDKSIKLPSPLETDYKLGDQVIIRGVEILPKRFMLIITILPCIILITSMIIIYLLTYNQALALICGVGFTLILFMLIWASRNRVGHEFNFSIAGQKNK